MAAAARVYTRKLEKQVSESTVRSIKNAYVEEVRKKRCAEDDGEVSVLPSKKGARPVLLGQELDQKVQLYLKKVREGGGAVSTRIVMAAARGLLLKYDSGMLAEFGGPVQINRFWAHSLLHRMKFVQRKATTAQSKYAVANFLEVKKTFLDEVFATVEMEEIPPDLILNWDQTGIKFVPASSWTMDSVGRNGWRWPV